MTAGASQGPLVSDLEKGDLYFRRNGAIWKVGYNGEGARAIPNASGAGGFRLTKNNLFFISGGQPKLVDVPSRTSRQRRLNSVPTGRGTWSLSAARRTTKCGAPII